MSPRSASSRAGTSRSSDVPAPEPTRTASFDLIAAFPKGLFCGECGRRAARASNQELGVVHKLCLCPGRCNGQLWRHEPAAYGSLPRDHAHRLGDRRRALAQCHATGGQRRAQALRKPAEDEAVHAGVGTAAADGGSLGTLSIAASFPIANGYLAKAVATFIAERPKVRVALQSLTSPQVLDRVVNREVELGIAYEPVVSSEVETRVLMRAGIACVMAADHPLARRKEVAVRDLEPYSIITYLPQALFRRYVDRALSAAGIVPNITAQVSVSLTGIMLARYGAGIALVEPLLVASMGLPGTVARPLKPRIDVKTLLIRHKTTPHSKVMNEFVGHLGRIVATEPGQ